MLQYLKFEIQIEKKFIMRNITAAEYDQHVADGKKFCRQG